MEWSLGRRLTCQRPIPKMQRQLKMWKMQVRSTHEHFPGMNCQKNPGRPDQ